MRWYVTLSSWSTRRLERGASLVEYALLLALMAYDVGPGDEVVCPSYTFFATASAVTRLGATPVFVDIEPTTYTMDPAKLEAAITSRTKAIMPVHWAGRMCDMDAILKIAKDYLGNY
mgnify:CR=1 FL=1